MGTPIFRPGNVVVLKTGGYAMTVERIRTSAMAIVACVWFVNGELHRDAFEPTSLMKLKS